MISSKEDKHGFKLARKSTRYVALVGLIIRSVARRRDIGSAPDISSSASS